MSYILYIYVLQTMLHTILHTLCIVCYICIKYYYFFISYRFDYVYSYLNCIMYYYI